MNPFLAVSYQPGKLPEPEVLHIEERAQRAWARFTADWTPPQPIRTGGMFVLAGQADTSCFLRGLLGDFAFLVGRPTPSIALAERVTARQVLEAGEGGLPRLIAETLPPFGGCLGCDGGKRLIAFTDSAGLMQVYGYQSDSWAAVSSSSLMLAAVAGVSVDAEGAGLSGLIGNLLGDDSLFVGVVRLPSGGQFDLREGRIRTIPKPRPALLSPGSSFQDSVDSVCGAFKTSVASCLAAEPEAALELSGGLDSRLILAAIPKSERVGRRSYTLGFPGSPDVTIAERIAHQSRLDHRFVDLSPLENLPPEEAFRLCREAAIACDGSANPFSRGILEWANQRMESTARFSGQNGEFARGFYYAGQPDADVATRRLVEMLIRWRITTNQKVDSRLFRRDFLENLNKTLFSRVNSDLSSGGKWLEATDEFYLKHRMGRWVGSDYSAVSAERVILAPFFSSELIEQVRRVPPSLKRGGRLMAGVLCAMDNDLASFPLDSGPAPKDLVDPPASVKWGKAVGFLSKAARKVGQRVFGTSRAPVGAEILHHRFSRLPNRIPFERARHLEFLNPAWFENWNQGQSSPDWVTLGWLLSLEWSLEFLGEESR